MTQWHGTSLVDLGCWFQIMLLELSFKVVIHIPHASNTSHITVVRYTEPYVEKLVDAYRWSAVYTVQNLHQLYVLVSSAHIFLTVVM